MSFKSLDFLLFFPLITILYFLVKPYWRWLLLLIASYYFYMCWRPEYAALLLATTAVDYWIALKISSSNNQNQRRFFLLISLISNLGVLFFFKYFNFFNENLRILATHFSWNYPINTIQLLLPIGISFYVFQSLSYTIDVYKRKVLPEQHFGYFALYVVYFPQLVAGPIERSTHLLPQLHKTYHFDYERTTHGLRLMAWGFLKKIVVADNLAIIVNSIYSSPQENSGGMLIVATIFFAFQIFCDFSGYTDIARGAARIIGIDLMQNFRCPYSAQSIKEFWQRWHISLSTWFKDYLYIPLGGNKNGINSWYMNIFLTFLISGLWHGANWTFIIWGLWHGILMILSKITSDSRKRYLAILRISESSKLLQCFRTFLTFTLVCIGWVFFRSRNIDEAFLILYKILDWLSHASASIFLSTPIKQLGLHNIWVNKFLYLKLVFFIIAMQFIEKRCAEGELLKEISHWPWWCRWLVYYLLMIVIIYWGRYDPSPFIYFQF